MVERSIDAEDRGGSSTRRRAAVAALAMAGLAVITALGAAQTKSDTKPAPAPVKKTTTTVSSAPSSAGTDSLKTLEAAVAKDSTNFDKNYRLGVAYLDRDRAVDAVRVFERCTKEKPKEVKAWVNLGAAYDAIGKGDLARQQYRVALAVNPQDEIALCRLGASLYAGGFRPSAMDTLRLALQRHPNSYCAYFTMGVAFADAQIYNEAIKCWQKVVDLSPDSPEATSAKESITTLKELLKQ
ncbi:MAG TPA: tetratricopeptide repeat protein [Candidatus Eisenbacteria bacterium]|nr:tetratricopeptide repeat protein [Candidatus Eisenbacteria bacterium]